MRSLSRCRRFTIAAVFAVGALLPIACGQSACAETIDAAYATSGTRTYSPPPNSGSRTYSGGTKTYSPPSNSGSRSGSSSTKTYSPPTRSGSRTSGSGTYSPPSNSGSRTTTRTTSTYTYHSSSGQTYTLPTHITTRTYVSPTHHRYVYHVHGYYHRGGYHDPWDPYDWTNYYNPASPWYHDAHLISVTC